MKVHEMPCLWVTTFISLLGEGFTVRSGFLTTKTKSGQQTCLDWKKKKKKKILSTLSHMFYFLKENVFLCNPAAYTCCAYHVQHSWLSVSPCTPDTLDSFSSSPVCTQEMNLNLWWDFSYSSNNMHCVGQNNTNTLRDGRYIGSCSDTV